MYAHALSWIARTDRRRLFDSALTSAFQYDTCYLVPSMCITDTLELLWCHLCSHWRMMTSSDGNIFHVTGPLWGEFTSLWWIPPTKASDAELWCFFFYLRLNKGLCKQTRRRWFETPSRSLWRHYNGHWKMSLRQYPVKSVTRTSAYDNLVSAMALQYIRTYK